MLVSTAGKRSEASIGIGVFVSLANRGWSTRIFTNSIFLLAFLLHTCNILERGDVNGQTKYFVGIITWCSWLNETKQGRRGEVGRRDWTDFCSLDCSHPRRSSSWYILEHTSLHAEDRGRRHHSGKSLWFLYPLWGIQNRQHSRGWWWTFHPQNVRWSWDKQLRERDHLCPSGPPGIRPCRILQSGCCGKCPRMLGWIRWCWSIGSIQCQPGGGSASGAGEGEAGKGRRLLTRVLSGGREGWCPWASLLLGSLF